MLKFGVVRNGEHLGIYYTRQQAQEDIDRRKAEDKEMVNTGWLTKRGADETRYHIQEVKGKTW